MRDDWELLSIPFLSPFYPLEGFLGLFRVVIVAHRLSTVSRADNILYMENGRIVEQGTHSELVARAGGYYALVRNQLELGK